MKKNEEMKKTPLPNNPPTLPIRNASPMTPLNGLPPFRTMRRMTDEIEKMFGDLFNFNMALNPFFMATPSFPAFDEFELPAWTPQIEVSNKKGELKVRADLPGMMSDDIDLEIIDNNLLISGERTMENEEEREGFYRTERNYGSFFRSIPLPEGADTEHVAATFNNGVLEIAMHVPNAKKKGKKVEIATHKPAVKAKAA